MDNSFVDIDFNGIADKHLAEQIRRLMNMIEQQGQQIAKLTDALARANEEIARLKGQPKRPRFLTSFQKSSSVTALLQEKSDGNKQWHKSTKKGTLPIDTHVQLSEEEVCSCGSRGFTILRTYIKLMQGMIIRRNNTAYHGREKQCMACGKLYRSSIPDGIKGFSFDSSIQTLISYMKFYGRFTHPILHGFFKGFGIQISYGEITAILRRNSKKLLPAVIHLKTMGVKQSRYIQSDATGAKRKHKGTGAMIHQHLHIVGNRLLSIFKITRHYNAQIMNQMLGRYGLKKPFLSDDGSPNGESCRCTDKQLCWVHEIRHYQKLFPFFNPYQKLQQTILTQWSAFYHLAKQYGRDPTENKKREIQEMFDTITGQTTGYTLLDKQLRLTKKKRKRLITFLDYPFLPIHNNQCEQDLREFVIMRKISGETKSHEGDRSIERHLSVIQTAKKQGLDVFATLHGLLTGQLSPAILTAQSA